MKLTCLFVPILTLALGFTASSASWAKDHRAKKTHNNKHLKKQHQATSLPVPKPPGVNVPVSLPANPVDNLIEQTAREAKQKVREMVVSQE